MLRALRILLALLGASAVLIAASILALGAGETAATAEGVFAAVTGYTGPPSEPWPPSMDSELRFYAALWGAYGIVLLRVAQRFETLGGWTPWLAAIFFLGGVGRAISHLSVGAPHPFFTHLMAIELALPPVLVLLWFTTRRAATGP